MGNEIFDQCSKNDFEMIPLKTFAEKYALAISTLKSKLRQCKIEEDRLTLEY